MNANWLILAIGLTAGALPSWWITSTYYSGVIAKEHEATQQVVIQQQEQNRLDLIAYAKRITKAGADHDKNTRTIRNLNHELDELRIHFPTCPVSDITEAGADSGEGGGVLPNPVDDLFKRLQKRTGRLIEEADTLNVDAIRANSQQTAAPSTGTH